MLTILVKTIANTSNNILAKSIADTDTRTAFYKYRQYQYHYFCDYTFYCLSHSAMFTYFQGHLLIKLIGLLLRNGKITIVYSDMMLMSKHCVAVSTLDARLHS